MKILFLANHCNTGGITTYMLNLSVEFVRRGHQVLLASSGGDALPFFQDAGVQHIEIPSLRVKCEVHPKVFKASFQVASIIKECGIDVVHSQTRVTQVAASLAIYLSGRGVHVSTCHGFFKPRLFRRLMPLWGNRVIAISPAVVEHLRQDFGVSSESISLVPNGIDTEKFKPLNAMDRETLRARYELGTAKVVGIIARLSDVKGHTFLIKAMNELVTRMPGVKCLIFGEGPLELSLRTQAAELGLGASILFYRVNGRPESLLPMFDVFALPSLQEGLGLSALEAQACGVPVVASKVGGLMDAVCDSRTGILVPPKDHLALSDALFKILVDQNLSARYSKDARDYIRAKFPIDDMVEKTLTVYTKAMANA